MLNKLKNLFSGKDAAEDSTAKKSPSGYFTPSTGAELLALPHRKKLLKQLWDNTSLPENVYEKDIQKNHGNIGQLIRRAEESWRLIEALRRYVCLPER